MIRILDHLKLNRNRVLLYALNPLVIIEGVGNLHFEIIMILFVILSIYLLILKKWLWTTLCIALSISVKMVSAILWPFLIPLFGFKRWLFYTGVLGCFLVLLFAPLWDSTLLAHFRESLDLYFRNFEFNASIYYAARAIGTWIKGYNPIAMIGPLLSICSLFLIVLLSSKNRTNKSVSKVLTMFILGFTAYLLLSTTVHPWYLLLMLAISPFVRLRYVQVWSGLVWISYSAYSTPTFQESLPIIFLEYLGLFTAIYMDRKEITKLLGLK